MSVASPSNVGLLEGRPTAEGRTRPHAKARFLLESGRPRTSPKRVRQSAGSARLGLRGMAASSPRAAAVPASGPKRSMTRHGRHSIDCRQPAVALLGANRHLAGQRRRDADPDGVVGTATNATRQTRAWSSTPPLILPGQRLGGSPHRLNVGREAAKSGRSAC